MYSSDDQSLDGLDDDDDDYDVPPAFRLDFSNIAGLSSVTETHNSTTEDGRDTNTFDDDDDDGDYDVPPAFRVNSSDVARLSLVGVWTASDDTRDVESHDTDDDDDDYDVLPNTLCPVKLETITDATTETELQSLPCPDIELYDFIRCEDVSNGDWLDDVEPHRTSRIDPDVSDDFYDYIGTHTDAERQQADPVFSYGDNFREGTGTDELYDYPPLCSSPKASVSHEVDDGSNWTSSEATVVKREHRSSLSDDYYDILPIRQPVLSPDQISVRKCSTSSECSVDIVGSVSQDFTTDQDGWSDNGTLRPVVSSEMTDQASGDCVAPVTTEPGRTQTSDDHDDVLPCCPTTHSDQLSVRKTTDPTSWTSTAVQTPTSCSTSPSDHQTGQHVLDDVHDDVTENTADTCSSTRPTHPHSATTSADENQSSDDSK